MAQLSDDSLAFGGPLMRVDELVPFIRDRVPVVEGIERVSLGQARGRVLASDVISKVAVPPFDNSAVDGYAVRYSDLAGVGETRLPVSDCVMAGHGAGHALAEGTAIRIFTGAPMPEGADTVFMQEDCKIDGNTVVLPAGLKPGANRRHCGEDVAQGAVVLARGCRLKPQDIALAAAVGHAHLDVRARVRVAIFSTGDEVQEAGDQRAASGIFDANRPLLNAMVEGLGGVVTDLGILKDDPDTLATALSRAALDHDVVLTTGGVSTGDADYVRTAVETIGRLVFWRIAIKPGRPVAMGLIPKGTDSEPAVFAGLPGNPVAAFVTFIFVLRPLLLQLAGAKTGPFQTYPVMAGFNYRKKRGRREYVRVSLSREGGVLTAYKFQKDGAGVLTSLTGTSGLVELSEDVTDVEPGMVVDFIPYESLLS